MLDEDTDNGNSVHANHRDKSEFLKMSMNYVNCIFNLHGKYNFSDCKQLLFLILSINRKSHSKLYLKGFFEVKFKNFF